MKHYLKRVRPSAPSRRSVTITLTVSLATLAALATLVGNLASTTVPDVLKPYVPYSWFALVIILLLGLIVTFWSAWYTSNQPATDSSLLSPISQPTIQGSTQASPSASSHQNISATTSIQQTGSAASSQSSAPTASSGVTPVAAVSPSSAPGSDHYHTCVISYATDDEPFVNKLYADLKAYGVPCWLADQDGKLGDKLRAEIYQAIDQLDKLLLVLSEHAIESKWVEEEVDVALDREHQQPGTFLLFPLRLDDTVFTTKKYWAITVRQRRIGDFRQWQQEAEYQKALQRVLRDLRI